MDRRRLSHTIGALSGLLLVCGSVTVASPENTGRIVGKVVETRGRPVAGASVSEPNGTVVSTDSKGRFELPESPAGTWELVLSHPDFAERRRTVVVKAGETVSVRVTMVPLPEYRASLEVSTQAPAGPVLADAGPVETYEVGPGAAPHQSAAEAVATVPGIIVLDDRGEPDTVVIRGAEPRLNATRLDGERIPSMEGDDRSAGLAVFPLDLLSEIEVQKTFSPMFDADAVGGVVNLVTPSSIPRTQARVGGGYDGFRQSGTGFASGLFSRRFARDRVGLVVALAADHGPRRTDRFETYHEELGLEKVELHSYELERTRLGALASLDWEASPRTSLRLRLLDSEQEQKEVERVTELDIKDEEIERGTTVGRRERRLLSGVADLTHLFEPAFLLEIRAGILQATERRPHEVDTSFLQEEVEFEPDSQGVWRPTNEDLEEFVLGQVSIGDGALRDRTMFSTADATLPLPLPGRAAELSAGVKLRRKDRDRNTTNWIFEPEEDIPFTDFLGGDPSRRIGPYRIGPTPPDVGEDLISVFDLPGERSLEEETGDYTAREDVGAFYAMLDAPLGPHLGIETGIRYEYTDTRYEGVTPTEEEEPQLVPTRGGRSWGFVMPSAVLTAEPLPELVLRAGLSRTYARPDYFDLVPYRLVDYDEEEIQRGNPALDPTESWNLDLSAEGSLGLDTTWSVATFFKSLDSFVFRRRGTEVFAGEEFALTRPENGRSAELFGLEASVTHRVDAGAFEGLWGQLHVSYTDSRAEVPDRSDRITLPGQAAWVTGLSLGLDRGRWHGRAHLSWIDAAIEEVGSEKLEDVYRDDRLQLEASLGCNVARRWELFLRGRNLTDAASRGYQGRPDRQFWSEKTGWAAELGLTFLP